MNPEIIVRHNAAANRYEAEVEGHLAVAEYVRDRGRVIFTHTFVPPELRGRGIAEKIVRTALDETGRAGFKIVPQCSFVARFIERHPEYQHLIKPD